MPAERISMPDSKRFPIEAFEDVLAANDQHASGYAGSNLTGRAARGLAVEKGCKRFKAERA